MANIFGFSITKAAPSVKVTGSAFERRTQENRVAADLIKAAAPNLPDKQYRSDLLNVLPPFATNPPKAVIGGQASDLETRAITDDPRELWYLALPTKLTPKQVITILRSALGGDVWQQWQLLALMRDTWPMLRKCEHELREAVSNVRYVTRPYCTDGEEPTESAKDKADLVQRAVANFQPNGFSSERGFSGMVYHLTDAMMNGLTMEELMWRKVNVGFGLEWLPRAATWVHPRHFTFTNDGQIAIFNDTYQRLYSNLSGPVGKSPDPRKFLCGQFLSASGSALGAGLMRPLAWYWAAVMFNRDWMFKTAQKFGAPFVTAAHNISDQNELAKLDAELAAAGNRGWMRYREGTVVTVENPVKMGADNPQVRLMEMADQAAAFLILGQEGTTKSQPGSLGGKDESKTEVKRERIEGLAKWVGNEVLNQFAMAVLLTNYGPSGTGECPTIMPDFTAATDPMAEAQRDQVFINAGVPMVAAEFYERHNLTMPEKGDLILKGGTLGIMAEPQKDVGAAPEMDPNKLLTDSADGERSNPSLEPKDPMQARQAIYRLLSVATLPELEQLETAVVAAERAPHLNGEMVTVNNLIKSIAQNHRRK